MTGKIDHVGSRALARRQYDVISRVQLLDLGFSRHAISHRIARGRLVALWPGVYHVGSGTPSRNTRFMAAVLASGAGAALSHESAAALWGIRKGGTNPIETSIPATRRVRLKGIRVHRRSPMPPATTLGRISLSRPLFTLIDLATRLAREPLEAALNEADKAGLLVFADIELQLEKVPKHPGVGVLRKLLDDYTRTDSNLERQFLAVVRKAQLPMPATQERVGPGRVDFHWPELGLVVETDGLTYHRTPMQQLQDRRRDQAHTAAGRTQLRFANLQIRGTPDEVASTLCRVARRLRQQRQ